MNLTGSSRHMVGLPLAGLSWLGRNGTRALAALVVLGIAFPAVGALLKPYVTAAVFVLLSIAFLRVDPAAFKTCLRRPALVLAATAWSSAALPILFGLGCLASGLPGKRPELFLALLLQGVASPMMASPSLAALMGLDATLVLVTLIAATALLPFTSPLLIGIFAGPGLAIPPLVLAAKLAAILTGAALLGYGLRRFFGPPAIERQAERINGLNILVLFVFVAALMEGVGGRFRIAPLPTLLLTALAFAVFFILFLLTVLLFLPAGRERALALGFMTSQRNLGLMLAATGGVLPDLTWLYFALSQFPIYLSPQLLQPLARRVIGRPLQAGTGDPGRFKPEDIPAESER